MSPFKKSTVKGDSSKGKEPTIDVDNLYHQVVKGRLNGRMIRIVANPSPFEQAEAHLVETMFYVKWAPSGESSISKP